MNRQPPTLGSSDRGNDRETKTDTSLRRGAVGGKSLKGLPEKVGALLTEEGPTVFHREADDPTSGLGRNAQPSTTLVVTDGVVDQIGDDTRDQRLVAERQGLSELAPHAQPE